MLARNLKMTPSWAMARITRGNGNMAPKREVDKPSSAPTATIHLPTGQPTYWKAKGRGAVTDCLK